MKLTKANNSEIIFEMFEVCEYYKFGFCKYNNNCNKKHIKEKCDNKLCEKKNCNLRHPKTCLYYEQYSYCKFGKFCLYEHRKDNCVRDKLEFLEKKLNEKDIIIDKLEDKIKNLEDRVVLLENKDEKDVIETVYILSVTYVNLQAVVRMV